VYACRKVRARWRIDVLMSTFFFPTEEVSAQRKLARAHTDRAVHTHTHSEPRALMHAVTCVRGTV
jgi:hypothetical protein